jgi:cytoplasmic iron level regulating protein YaaA (DUF328/UPF0246 family)
MSITVLIHSSKTMRSPVATSPAAPPLLISKATALATYLQTLTAAQLQTAMHISGPLSHKVCDMLAAWSGEPSQVIVHTKIARGAFARWLMTSRIISLNEMVQFNDLNYCYDAALSTSSEPTFVCKIFGGIGLSMRIQKA